MGKKKANWNILDELYDEIESRKGDDPDKSHTARLFSRGIDKIAQKLGEDLKNGYQNIRNKLK